MFPRKPAVLLTILFLSACSRDLSYEPSLQPMRALTTAENSIKEGAEDFGFALLKQLAQESQQENLFISPLSISMALTMTLNGAAGETEAAMRQTLKLELTEEERNEAFRSLIALLLSADPRVKMEIANSIWIRRGFPVEEDFLRLNRTYLDAMVQQLDFNDPASLGIINRWVSEKTHGKIDKILESIPGEMVMYLINAVYFKGTWKSQFDKNATRADEFFPIGAAAVPCSMMVQTNDAFSYYANEQMQAIDLPYGNGRFSMTILLPAYGKTPAELLESLDKESLRALPKKFSKQRGTLHLVKFKLEYKKKLNDALSNMGMAVAFTEQADFTRINRNGPLFISEVLHKSFVQVDEEGTEAAAATSVGIALTSAGDSNGFIMVVNRPFLFFIREQNSGAVLFLGIVNRP
ncbi:MAG: serpin family protein [candidate division KSB1 bacterium]|nr:serpin family protein [candidate division KSB1 bacterium]MDZ7346765.1 serpin family protein [candidate division KSB1 bacterium]